MKAWTKRAWLALAAGVFAAGGIAWGEEPSDQGVRADAWKNAWGTEETCPFWLEEGRSTEKSEFPVVSRADWVTEHEGRTYLLYDVFEGRLQHTYFNGEPDERLWIGLVGEDGEIQRKILLARGVKDISGVRRDENGEAYVEATDEAGALRRIPLQYPEPWPELKAEGGELSRFYARLSRLRELLWEDWPDNGSGYATEHVEAWIEEAIQEEYTRAVEALRNSGIPEALREALAEEPGRTEAMVKETVAAGMGVSYSQHWANVEEMGKRQSYLLAYLENWLEGAAHPDGWTTVCGAKVEFRGKMYQATNGVVIVPLRPEEGFDGSELAQNLIVRLAPDQVREEEGRTRVGFELVMPDPEGGPGCGSGTFEADADGILRVKEMRTAQTIPWADEEPGDE
jgi:hypothetical protein